MELPREIKLGEIYELAKKYMAPEDIDHHESDLYLKVNPVSAEIVQRIPRNEVYIGTFISNIPPHVRWYDIWWAYPREDRT